ncbi:nitronate monooxygenase [Ancrocorticia populi]|uniref:Propionate 3-nitronate monooxygenase n=1 Tax=Ancrocorticia populi TaxID=2175228 RepID=A0A2V1K975_9ACTO|nr:nitronate monooxygenase [Ancrocorticia populi]PWF27673.1 2-nitropropane dioxygenase [Ancrocorticia populi]
MSVDLPIVAAPMAGGPSTPALVRAVAEAGGFGFLAGGYKSRESLAAEISHVREHTERFGVNLFVPSSASVDRTAFQNYARHLQPEAEAYGIQLDLEPVADDDRWAQKLALLIEQPVPVVSLTFALPEPAVIAALQQAGSRVLMTVTTPTEARQAEAAGVDGLIVQGPRAGGHSATFDPPRRIEDISTQDLVLQVREGTELPIIAAGGVDGPAAVKELLDAGVQAVAVGTLLMRTDEAGTSDIHRRALTDPAFTETTLTRAFTGRLARALRNHFIDSHDAYAVDAYPAVHYLTKDLRQAAAKAGDAQGLHLWAGTGHRSAPRGPAADVIRWLGGIRAEPLARLPE